MTIQTLNAANFDDKVRGQDLTIIDFWAPWCGPCLAFAPIMDEVSTLYPDAFFAKVNIDEEKQLAEDFSIRSVPMIMIFRREFAVFAEPGTQTASSLKDLIEQAKMIDINELRATIPKES
jgi:thioredoxin